MGHIAHIDGIDHNTEQIEAIGLIEHREQIEHAGQI